MKYQEDIKNLKKASGIYKILCLTTGKFYIGSAIDLYSRLRGHRSLLNLNKHYAKYMQYSWNKYGKEVFVFEVLEFCAAHQTLNKEQEYLDKLRPYDNTIGFNSNIKSNSRLGYKYSDKEKEDKRKQGLLYSGIDFDLISPSGERFVGKGVTYFAKQHGLDGRGVSRLVKGEYTKYKGWTVSGREIKVFKFLSPTNELVEVSYGRLGSFAESIGAWPQTFTAI